MGKVDWRAWWLVPAITAASLVALSLVKGLSGWTVFDALRPGTSAIDVLSAMLLLWITHLALSRMRIDWRGGWVVPVAVVAAFLAMGFLEGFTGKRLDPPQFWGSPGDAGDDPCGLGYPSLVGAAIQALASIGGAMLMRRAGGDR